ncbi:PAS domain-containing hybrid sensor histidine kinase/response regulator [Pseudodesulfovibrio sp. zrk46]|uniref:PAS domain-containing hybrid sensor histidine kinase/response regulator n=1 Tax=Pseudodesulfovibrio sp. zrk46 TaxID=2725288 RepID=UPI001449B3D4|nr:PAS domain-containing hybrid sensor histidine kinase/response regulator [Pseudodesulfovibrio sp. zrk46]QJB55695.1 response regulator [Pseudodesulfovibrio sp. zrk46]
MSDKLNKSTTRSYVSIDETSRALLDSAVESSFVMDVNGHILAANKAAALLMGLKSVEELENHDVYSFLPEDVAAIRREKVQDAIEKRASVRFEEEVDDRNLVHSIVPVFNPWGDVVRLAVSTLDLTELRKSDEDLRREQQRQIFFMESLPGIVYHLYPDKSIRYANRYFRKYFGSPKGKNCKEALECSKSDCNACPPMAAMEQDRAVEWDWTDSKGRTFHLQCSPMTDSAGERMIMVLGIDITARKRAEDDLQKAHDRLEDRVRQRTKELEKANSELTNKSMRLVSAMKKADAATRAKSAFLANMSHEIRTPLNAVLGMTELALRSVNESKRTNYLQRVMQAGNSLLSVINDILDFSKIEARKLTLEKIDFDLRKTLDSAMDIHRTQTSDKSLFLDNSIADDVPNVLVGDPYRLKQVLINLVSNAVKFTEQGGVSIDISLVSAPPKPKKGDEVVLEFAVTDTGVGIPKDKQKAIFKSFLQADDSVTRKHGGTGLGLSICTLLVELMQGRLRIASEEGKGSTFAFTAKFIIGDEANVARDIEATLDLESLGLSNLKVLLADDNKLNLELASTLLIEQGHNVVCVENGAQALEAVKKDRFDIILMDVQMPIMDGISATRAIRNPNSGATDPKIPIVAITAHALKGDKERFMEAGMNDYIAKPIKMTEFYSTLARAMHGADLCGDEKTGAEDAPCAVDSFNRQGALDMLGGRKDLLTRMDEIFLRDIPGELEELISYMANHDWEEAKRLAHSIKGSSRTVGAERAGAVAEQVEFFCKQKDVNSAEEELKILEAEVKTALQYITDDMQS